MSAPTKGSGTTWVGRSIRRLEDPALVRGQGHFTAVSVAESGLLVPGDAKALVVTDLDHDGWPDFVVSRNNDTTLAFRNRGVEGRKSLGISLRGKAGNLAAIGARITVELTNGGTQTIEVAAGSGAYSQSTTAAFFGFPKDNPPRFIAVRWPDGKVNRYPTDQKGPVYFLRRE